MIAMANEETLYRGAGEKGRNTPDLHCLHYDGEHMLLAFCVGWVPYPDNYKVTS